MRKLFKIKTIPLITYWEDSMMLIVSSFDNYSNWNKDTYARVANIAIGW